MPLIMGKRRNVLKIVACMKKILMLGLILTVIINFCVIQQAESAETANQQMIKDAIAKYKDKNYIGCISDLKMYTDKDTSNAVAWYYLGNSYMNIAMQQEAYAAFDKVIALNTVPKLTSYSIQAELCMQNKDNCNYKDFTYEEINQLKKDPMSFLHAYKAKQVLPKKDAETEDIERLINGGYPQNIHPSALNFIQQERSNIKATQINEKR